MSVHRATVRMNESKNENRRRARTALLFAAAGAAVLLMTTTGCTPRTQQKLFEERSSEQLTRDGDRAAEKGQIEDAALRYDEAIDRHPGNYGARVKLARIYLDLGEPLLAREQLEIVRPERPNDPEVLDLLGQALAELGDGRGIDRRLRPIAERTNAPADWARLGRYLGIVGDADEAEAALLRAAAADGGRTIDYQVALANFYLDLGDRANALRRYRMALFLDVDDESVRGAIRDLGEIPGPTFALRPEEADS